MAKAAQLYLAYPPNGGGGDKDSDKESHAVWKFGRIHGDPSGS
jgi:hypothetical protein